MSVARTSTEMFGNSYIQNLTIVLSTASIPDFEACAMEIVEHCMYNTFSDIQFSYDVIGYPSKLQGTVYLNDMDFAQNNVLFSFSYAPCQTMTGPYNIVQNQRSYQLTIH